MYCEEFKRSDSQSGTFAYDFPKTSDGKWVLPMNPYDDAAGRKFPGGEIRNPVSGGMYFEFWVRDPAPNWNIRKRFPDWEHSAAADEKCKPLEPAGEGKVCWGFHLEGFCYRTSWSEKLLHVPLGDFREKLTDGNWHHVAMKQEIDDRLGDGERFLTREFLPFVLHAQSFLSPMCTVGMVRLSLLATCFLVPFVPHSPHHRLLVLTGNG